jgi:hypothetical protein
MLYRSKRPRCGLGYSGADAFGQAEIQDFNQPFGRNEDIRGL